VKRTLIIMLLAAGTALAATGCFNPFRPLVGTEVVIAEPAPAATSAVGVLNRFRWCWVNRRIAEYEELFTDDFQFAFSDVEAVDNLPIPRWEEIDIARKLFVDGTTSEPRAKRIDLDFSSALRQLPDQRPGKVSTWHKQINTGVVLRAELADDIWLVQGDVTFYMTRGDSALIPQVLLDRGFTKDSKRWYIDRWEDKTSSGEGGASLIETLLARARAQAPGGAPHARAASSPLAATGTTQTPGTEIRVSWGGLMSLYR
jgi:hypothetical protein